MTTHEKLKTKWNLCEHGVKQRVLNDEIPQATVQYILATPTYENQDKMNWLIEAIERHAKIVQDEIVEMYNQIESI